MSRLVHIRRNTKTAKKYPQRVTVQAQGGGTTNSRGAKNPNTTWANVSGLTALFAQIAPRDRGQEAPGSGQGEAADWDWDIFLNSYQATITERHRVLDDDTGDVYNVVRVDHDPTGNATTLRCRRVN